MMRLGSFLSHHHQSTRRLLLLLQFVPHEKCIQRNRNTDTAAEVPSEPLMVEFSELPSIRPSFYSHSMFHSMSFESKRFVSTNSSSSSSEQQLQPTTPKRRGRPPKVKTIGEKTVEISSESTPRKSSSSSSSSVKKGKSEKKVRKNNKREPKTRDKHNDDSDNGDSDSRYNPLMINSTPVFIASFTVSEPMIVADAFENHVGNTDEVGKGSNDEDFHHPSSSSPSPSSSIGSIAGKKNRGHQESDAEETISTNTQISGHSLAATLTLGRVSTDEPWNSLQVTEIDNELFLNPLPLSITNSHPLSALLLSVNAEANPNQLDKEYFKLYSDIMTSNGVNLKETKKKLKMDFMGSIVSAGVCVSTVDGYAIQTSKEFYARVHQNEASNNRQVQLQCRLISPQLLSVARELLRNDFLGGVAEREGVELESIPKTEKRLIGRKKEKEEEEEKPKPRRGRPKKGINMNDGITIPIIEEESINDLDAGEKTHVEMKEEGVNPKGEEDEEEDIDVDIKEEEEGRNTTSKKLSTKRRIEKPKAAPTQRKQKLKIKKMAKNKNVNEAIPAEEEEEEEKDESVRPVSSKTKKGKNQKKNKNNIKKNKMKIPSTDDVDLQSSKSAGSAAKGKVKVLSGGEPKIMKKNKKTAEINSNNNNVNSERQGGGGEGEFVSMEL